MLAPGPSQAQRISQTRLRQRAEKREILESWWQDAVRLSESEGENMGGGNEPMLKRVNDALLELERQTGVGAAHKRTIT